ncbi:unnamed protein product [Chondrus crispus]|uniref:Uncharacterized protein n=1 Tax=Chondrus crispus TaxID=2769 RepID=R7QC04_CHOCR|nr:unnamed protein product [Chondrus crispus]CDF36017.1 unnamed protein product [Chondrus crispus]|eukprot:XP_005715836.1 unnamed protein product [Chondrus crispus]
MDRTGSGYVLREEFIRYAPFIGPVADAAVAGIVFDELVREQSRQSAEKEAKAGEQPWHGKETRASKFSNSTKRKWQSIKDDAGLESCIQQHGLRRRRQPLQSENITSSQPMRDFDDIQNPDAAQTSESPSRDLYPPSVALRYDAWRPFFIAAQDKYYSHDEDWVLVKQELGIDPFEVLIKSQGALDHSDVFPTLGKLYLSQRYLIFHAAIGRNHYVARLGSMSQVEDGSIPLMMRDSFKVHLESEIKAAIDGISALKKDEPSGSTAGKDDRLPSRDGDGSKETTLSEHVGKLMRQYTAGRKPLQFSLLEFRETKHRDHWVHLIGEMVAAHKLHVQLGFGSSGRVVPKLEQPESSNDSQPTVNTMLDNEEKIREILKSRSLNYTRSPFRNEPSPPLLAVAAHANIARYRALRLVTDERTSKSLLIFTDPERNAGLINWYTESVRAYNNQSGRSWIERALATIRDNMDSNDRMYRVQDDEPFDVSRLGEAIGRFADLCSPLARFLELISHLFQWRNPPATILAILVCLTITVKGWISYVPACMLFSQALCIVDAKYNYFGLGMGRTESEDAERRQANVLKLVAQVHDTLAATQNVIGRMNRELGKLEALYLWGSEEWHTWVAVGFLCSLGLFLLLIPSRLLFLPSFFFLFFKHFLPPTNPAMKFWESLPSRVQPKQKKRRSKFAIEKRSRVRKPELSGS